MRVSPAATGGGRRRSGRTRRRPAASRHLVGARRRRPGGSGCGTGSRWAATRARGSRRRGCVRSLGPDRRVGHRDRAEQRRGVRVRRMRVEHVGVADLAHPAQVHDRHPVADVLHDGEVVGDEDQRQAVAGLHVLEQVEDLRLHRHVEGGHRLVADDQLRLGDHGPGDRDALALPAGELVRPAALGDLGVDARPSAAARRPWPARPCLVADLPDVEALGDDVLDRRRGSATRSDPGRSSGSGASCSPGGRRSCGRERLPAVDPFRSARRRRVGLPSRSPRRRLGRAVGSGTTLAAWAAAA